MGPGGPSSGWPLFTITCAGMTADDTLAQPLIIKLSLACSVRYVNRVRHRAFHGPVVMQWYRRSNRVSCVCPSLQGFWFLDVTHVIARTHILQRLPDTAAADDRDGLRDGIQGFPRCNAINAGLQGGRHWWGVVGVHGGGGV